MLTPAHAEEAVLGTVMSHNESYHDICNLLNVDHFTNPLRRKIWSVVRDGILAGEPTDAVSVMEAIPDESASVIQIAECAGRASSVLMYAGMVRNNWRRREAASIAQRLMAGAKDSDDGAVDEAIAALMALNSSVAEHEFTGKQAISMAFDQAQAAFLAGGKLPGITTGLLEMDEILGGFHDSDLTIIGGRPAMGKTAFMLGLAEAASEAGHPVGIVSAEQPAEQIGIRRIALSSGVGATRVRSGSLEEHEWSKLGAGLAKAKDRPMWIYDRSAVTLDELIGIARKWKHTHGIKALYIDYAQRITVPGADRITEVSQVARGLKNLARDMQIPVITLAQVKAAVDTRPDKRPTAGDLANSDELTREADQILMLYRDEVYNRDSQGHGICEVLIEKNRHGPTGYKKVAFHGETMLFADLPGSNKLRAAA